MPPIVGTVAMALRWHITYLFEAYPEAIVEVFDKNLQLVFKDDSRSDKTGWDGSFMNGYVAPEGAYYDKISNLYDREDIKGVVCLIR